jgi:hypothetical protein
MNREQLGDIGEAVCAVLDRREKKSRKKLGVILHFLVVDFLLICYTCIAVDVSSSCWPLSFSSSWRQLSFGFREYYSIPQKGKDD